MRKELKSSDLCLPLKSADQTFDFTVDQALNQFFPQYQTWVEESDIDKHTSLFQSCINNHRGNVL